jgi:hypothetical protein
MNDFSKRHRMQSILQLEQEFTKMTMYMRDKRFSATHPSSLGIPMDRIILCLLHLPMRTHEKVLTSLFHSACEHRTHEKSKPIFRTQPGQLDVILKAIHSLHFLTVSRDYTAQDLEELELACDETYRLLVAHCGRDKAVTNYFHYIGAGHVLWMCQMRGNIWRFRNEGVEAFNKTLSKRYNMFNSTGNKGNLRSSSSKVNV